MGRRTNVGCSIELVEQAALLGVRRFILETLIPVYRKNSGSHR